jgi:hypothetical protein
MNIICILCISSKTEEWAYAHEQNAPFVWQDLSVKPANLAPPAKTTQIFPTSFTLTTSKTDKLLTARLLSYFLFWVHCLPPWGYTIAFYGFNKLWLCLALFVSLLLELAKNLIAIWGHHNPTTTLRVWLCDQVLALLGASGIDWEL